MKKNINSFIDWFENRFNFIIDIVALIGALFTILMAIVLFVMLLVDSSNSFPGLGIIVLPGIAGFLAILMLFALRITRHLTKN